MFWYLDYFEYVKFDGDVPFFCVRPFLANFVQNIHLAFWCYLVNLPAVYSKRLKASGFSCLESMAYLEYYQRDGGFCENS